MEEVPKQLVARFRTVALERLDRIEEAWVSLIEQRASAETETALYQDMHTLKGDARVVGFADVALLGERLEELVCAARDRRFRIHEDVDVVATMAFQFLRMLLRKKAGISQGGIDLGGFLKHIDDVLAEWPRAPEQPHQSSSATAMQSLESVRIPQAVRQRLGAVTAQVFVEYLAAKEGSASRARLAGAWQELARQLSELDAVSLTPLLRAHALSVRELASELGKEVDIVVETEEVRVGIEVLDGLNAALVHTLRNAIDHGIEKPDVRVASGKPRRGVVRIRVVMNPESIELVVTDDGCGVDLARVKQRAVAAGLITLGEAELANEQTLLSLLFRPGFSLRDEISAISGRGVGMDAVQSAVKAVRGRVTIATSAGAGSTVSLSIPQTASTMEVMCVPSTSSGVVFAVPSAWTAKVVHAEESRATPIDPATGFGLSIDTSSPTIVTLHRDRDEFCLAAGGAPTVSRATRICPTSPFEALELVQVGDEPVLLLRPEAFFPMAALAQS